MGAFSSFVFEAFMKIGVLRGFYWNWGFFSKPLGEPEFLVAFFWKLLWAQNFLLVCQVLGGLRQTVNTKKKQSYSEWSKNH